MKIVAADNHEIWNGFVAEAGGSLLQSWQWGEFKRRQGWRVLRLMALQSQVPQATMQVLMRIVPGLGSFCYAPEGPVLTPGAWSGTTTTLGALLAEARRRSTACGALALTMDPLTNNPDAAATLSTLGLQRSLRNVQPATTAVVDLDRPQEELWRGLARDARYRINRAQRDGVELRPGGDGDIAAFAAMLHDTGRRKGFSVRDASYLHQLTGILCTQHSGSFIVGTLDGEVIGATLVATFGRRAASLYTASNERGRAVGVQHLLHWEAILQAQRSGCAIYDFRGIDGSDNPSERWAGLNFFKQRFGTRREDYIGAWDDIYRSYAYHAFLLALDARRRLPGWITQLKSMAGYPARIFRPSINAAES